MGQALPQSSTRGREVTWPLQDIPSLQRFCKQANQVITPLPTCKAHNIAIVLHNYCARYAPPPTLGLHALHNTILVMAILCKGQAVTDCRNRCRRETHIVLTLCIECRKKGEQSKLEWSLDVKQ